MSKPVPQATDVPDLHRQALAELQAGRLAGGIALLEKAISIEPDAGGLHKDLGTAWWQKGDPVRAEKHYKTALRLSPDDPHALNNYGAFLLEQRRIDEADHPLKKAFRLKPDHYEIPNNLGLLHYRRGNYLEAGPLFVEAIRLAPGWPAPYANLGNVMRDMGRLPQAEQAYLQALKLNPQNPVALGDLGMLYTMQIRDEEALDCLKKSLALCPQDEAVWVALLAQLEAMNRLDEMDEALRKTKPLFPSCPGVLVHEAKLLGRRGRTKEAIVVMEKCRKGAEDNPRRSHPFVVAFFSELGRLYDLDGQADKAFACFSAANRREADSPDVRRFDRTLMRREINRVREGFTAEIAGKALAGTTAPAPLTPTFLVGFPRSGTTLLEQILAGHPAFRVAEERPAVEKMAEGLCARAASSMPSSAAAFANGIFHAAGLTSPQPGDSQKLREVYYKAQGLDVAAPNQRLFVDKMPLNMLHLGLIHRVFPEAKVVLALRHPCDAVLSCYMQRFLLNPAMAHFLDLREAALFYSDAFQLWEHYRGVLDAKIHVLRYENLVADFRPTMEPLLEFLGAGWDEALLDFHKTARTRTERIQTPSFRQVTEKLYTRASGRWLRYRRHLEPVLDILAPHVARYGYTLE